MCGKNVFRRRTCCIQAIQNREEHGNRHFVEKNEIKYCIVRSNDTIKVDERVCSFGFLTFKSKEIRDIFLENHLNLIKQFYEL